jgi:beta-RFAP synthase
MTDVAPFPARDRMITIRTASRLHFGLLGLADDTSWPNHAGEPLLPARAFGGVGLMVQDPGVQVRLEPSPAWVAIGPLAERALAFGHQYAAAIRKQHPNLALPCQTIVVERAAPEHAGLGTGTQLSLATAQALARVWGLNDSAEVMARQIGRGLRSAIGVHGFKNGGFVVEGGKRTLDELSPLVARVPVPDVWRIVLIRPAHTTGLHGALEKEAFSLLTQQPSQLRHTEALCRLVLLGLLPALIERDFQAFSEALYDFNTRSGQMFTAVQGGIYASPPLADMVAYVRSLGVTAAGQSSWGPTVFAIVEDHHRALDLSTRLSEHFGLRLAETVVTKAWNAGPVIA